MRKWIFFLILVILLALFQVTLLDYFKIFKVKPDLLLIGVVIASLIFDLRWSFILSILLGIFKDTFLVTTFGINTLLFPLCSFLIVKLSKEITIDDNLMRLALVFIVSIVHNTLTGLILIYLGNFIPLGIFLRTVFLSAVYTTAIFPLVILAIRPLKFFNC